MKTKIFSTLCLSLLFHTFIVAQQCQSPCVIAPITLCIEDQQFVPCSSMFLNIQPDQDNLLGGDNMEGIGCKMFWQNDKCAIRGGRLVNNPEWDADSLGLATASFGQDTKAMGLQSFAVGKFSKAMNNQSVAMGHSAVAENSHTLAIGHSSVASGNRSAVLGFRLISNGSIATAIGSNSESNSNSTITIGEYLTADGQNNMVIGKGVDANNHLVNTISRSLMIGFGSDIPTVFVERATSSSTFSKVAIGSTDPAQTLDIEGAIRIDTTSNNVDGSLRFTGTRFEGHVNGNWITLASPGGSSVFNLNNTNAFYTGGQIGIGTSTPSSALEVNGDVGISGSIVGPSDLRLKTDITELEHALSIIRNLQPSTYQYDHESSLKTNEGVQYGFIAQEVKTILPQLVNENALQVKEGDQYLGLERQQLITVLIQALKELEEENKNLYARYDDQLTQFENQLNIK